MSFSVKILVLGECQNVNYHEHTVAELLHRFETVLLNFGIATHHISITEACDKVIKLTLNMPHSCDGWKWFCNVDVHVA